jgi:FdrA protein
MVIRTLLKRNTYYDSITLMSVAQAAKDLPGVEDVGVVMATEVNLELLQNAELLPAAFLAEQQEPPCPEDLLIVVRATDEAHAQEALAIAEERLTSRGDRTTPSGATTLAARSLEMALQRDETANLAVISVAGEHAWLEAEQALRHGLHVFLFSDNVPIEQEQRLKALAISKGLLLMGPDCGTAIINGTGLGFSNVVKRGSIGIVGASGTGMQQIICLIATAGMGISQAIGTGGRDLSEDIGGIMMRSGLELLANDAQTDVIVLVSKPPAERVAHEILAAAQLDKPVVAVFLGAAPERFNAIAGKAHLARTLTGGAELAVSLAGGDSTRVPGERMLHKDESRLATARTKLAPSQRYIRALYSGGTLCDEAMLLISEQAGAVASNIPLRPEWGLAAGEIFRGHTALDLGSDEFTRGRPHPMIDPTLRLEYLTRTAEDPETAVILMDIVLGFCAHQNPAAVYAPAISQACARAAAVGRSLPVIVSICGTEGDPQRLSMQRKAFEAAGALAYESNVAAAYAAVPLVSKASSSNIDRAEVTHHD